MSPIKLLFVSILAWIPLHSSIQAQSDSNTLKQIVSKLDHLAKNKAEDLIYIQTSKGIYENGEDLWFKAYSLDAQYLFTSNRSKTLYLLLTREKDQRVYWNEKYEITDGFTDGHIYLNDSLPDGNYLLTAYSSQSILKSPDEFHAVRKIKLFRKIENNESSGISDLPIKKTSIGLSLFPEGGSLISGLYSRMAFKAVNEIGNPIEVKGKLYENDKPIVDLKSEHLGMGSLDFVPDANKKYHLKLEQTDSIYYLPKILGQGIAMHVKEQNSTSITLYISQSPRSKKQKVYLRTQVRGVSYSIAEGNLQDSLNIKIPLVKLPQGIAEVTLYDENFRPVTERLVYVNAHKKLTITTDIPDSIDYQAKEKVTLTLKVTDDDGKPVIANLGISIHDWISSNGDDPKNIMTHFYLSTQLRGKIYDPEYYFEEENKERLRALDLLLLTQGWRRYVWSEINLSKLSSDPAPVLLDGINGVVINPKKSKDDNESQPLIIAYNPNNEAQKDIVLLDSLNKFVIGPKYLKFREGGSVYLKLMVSEKSRSYLNLEDDGFNSIDQVRKSTPLVYPSPSSGSKKEDDHNPFLLAPDIVQLNEIEVNSKRHGNTREKYLRTLDSLAKIEISDYVCKYNILNCAYHVGHKDNFKPVEDAIYLYMEYYNGSSWIKGHPKLNGAEYWRNPPLPPYSYPKLTDDYLLKKFNIVRAKGYYGHKEFYQPNYETQDSSFMDYRNTLLWNPSVITDKHGEATISFFCSDLNGLFLGTIEGIDGKGLLGKQNFSFLVTKAE